MLGRFVRVKPDIAIDRSPEDVFDYVTTPALWHTWHPATVAVRNAPNRPLVTGETVVERVVVAGWRAEVLWTVRDCVPPQLWEITADNAHGAARIVYRISPSQNGCRFERTLDYRSKRWPWRLFDSTLTRWMFERQSSRALRNLAHLLRR